MNKILKFCLVGTGVIVGLAIAFSVYVAATFNPNAYKAEIIGAVKKDTQRILSIGGDIGLSFFPRIGVKLGRVSLSDFKSDTPFASVESARVSLALLPLLSRQLVVDEVKVSGLQATLVKHRDGTTNIDDLLSQEEKGGKVEKREGADSPGMKIDIAAFSIDKSTLTYRDEAAGGEYVVKELNLNTGRIISGLPTRIDLSVGVQSTQLQLDIVARLKTLLTFDLAQKQCRLKDIDLQVSGTAIDSSKLKVQVSGDVGADLGNQTFTAVKFILDLEMEQPEQALQVHLTSPFAGNLPARQLTTDDFRLTVNASGDKLPGKSLHTDVKGSLQVDGTRENGQLAFAGTLQQSRVQARIGVNGFADPAIHFDGEADQFDADLYLPGKAEKSAVALKTEEEQAIDLSGLRKLNLEGTLRVGSLKAANVKVAQFRADVRAHDGKINVSPLSAKLYDGTMDGSLGINAQGVPSIAIKQKLSGINVAPLTRDAADLDTLEGKGDIGMDLTMQGNTVSEMKRSLRGTMALDLVDGAVRGIDIIAKLHNVKEMASMVGVGAQTHAADKTAKTEFNELKATFKVSRGVAHNNDLFMKSSQLHVVGAGDVNINNGNMDFLAKATVAAITVPVRVKGPVSDLQYTLDFGSMVGGAAIQMIESTTEEVKTKAKETFKRELPGLFR